MNDFWHSSTQLEHLVYFEVGTSVHVPLTTWQLAYWRHRSPGSFVLSITFVGAGFGPH